MLLRFFSTILFTLASMSCASKAIPAFYPDFLELSAPLFAVLPDLQKCQTGQLQETEKQNLLSHINSIRQLHGLASVTLNHDTEASVKQAALMFAVNGQISHNPPTTWQCYSEAGANAALKSIISGGVTAKNIAFYSPEQDFIAWLTDINAINIADIGHRRILLDPFLASIAYARVSGRISKHKVSVGSALWPTAMNSSSVGVSADQLIAYPYHDYPARYFADGTVLSVSLLIDKTNKQGNAAVDFSTARIHVSNENTDKIQVKHIQYDNKYYGIPNNLQFIVSHIEPNLRYQVSVAGVRINGIEKTYTYWFRIVPENN